MAPDRYTAWLSAAVDGELGFWRRWRLAWHMASCRECASRMEQLQLMQSAVRASLTYHRAPPGLAQRIGAVLPRENVTAPAHARRRLVPLTGAGLVGALAGVALTLLVLRVTPGRVDAGLARALVDGHVRSMLIGHLMDVETSDQHTVKPWLSARVDVSPPVRDFAAEGFPLLGGRKDYVDGHEAAVVVYRHAKHMIDLYAWAAPDAADLPFRRETRQGFNLIFWRHGGIEYAAISDVEMPRLAAFSRLVAGAE
jgi:anti-sigma factor RsiW